MQTTHMNTKSSNGLILFTTVAERDEGLLVEIYRYMYNVDPSSRWAQTSSLPRSCPWIPPPQLVALEFHSLQSPQLLACMGPAAHSLNPVAGTQTLYIHKHAEQGVSQPEKHLEMEFSKKLCS